MKLKRLLAALLCLLLLCACGTNTAAPAETESPKVPVAPPDMIMCFVGVVRLIVEANWTSFSNSIAYDVLLLTALSRLVILPPVILTAEVNPVPNVIVAMLKSPDGL